jgi:glutamate-ammonia-ligase adenylyltransferase
MGKPSPAGIISQVDPRLRPDGEKGTLTVSLAACEAYYTTRAQLWEIQALTRARAICGPHGDEFVRLAQRLWRLAGNLPDLFPQIDAMRERIRRARGTGAEILDYKTGLGGIVEAEFLVQALQMRRGLWNPSFTGALEMLREDGLMSDDEAEWIARSYDFLRRCDSVLRRWENKGSAALPPDEQSQSVLARRVGAKSLSAFGDEYRAARETIHAVYVRKFAQQA